MSATMHRLDWGVTTADTFKMSERELGRSGLPDDVPREEAEDWAMRELTKAMEEAGTAFIEAHPGMFKVGLT